MQKRNGQIFLAIAIAFGIAAAFLAQRWAANQTPDSVAGRVEMASVVVARSDLAIATTLDARLLETVPWPKDYTPREALANVELAVGRVLRRPVAAGEAVVASALFDEGTDGGLPAVISAKMRAVSVKVDQVIGVAGFVKPGTRVDVLATLRRIDWRQPLPFSRAILQDVRVLAIDQKLEQVRDGEPEIVSVVTLEVAPQDAQKLTYASHEGRLQLAMRSPGDDEIVRTRNVGVATLLDSGSSRSKGTRVASASSRVQIIRGAKSEVKKL